MKKTKNTGKAALSICSPVTGTAKPAAVSDGVQISERTPLELAVAKVAIRAAVKERLVTADQNSGLELFKNETGEPVELAFERIGANYGFYWHGGTVLVTESAFRFAERLAAKNGVPVVYR